LEGYQCFLVITHSSILHSCTFQLINCPLCFSIPTFSYKCTSIKVFYWYVNGPENLWDCKWRTSLLLMVIAVVWLNEACREFKIHVLWWIGCGFWLWSHNSHVTSFNILKMISGLICHILMKIKLILNYIFVMQFLKCLTKQVKLVSSSN
jgi:hypothetical protein